MNPFTKRRPWILFILSLVVGNHMIACDIVKNGAAQAVIVIPGACTKVVEVAAEELRFHIEKATGVRLDVITEGTPMPEQMALIFLGPCRRTREVGINPIKLPATAYCIRIMGREMFLVGKDGVGTGEGIVTAHEPMGTLRAVDEWLDRYAGVRWLWPGELGTVVPRTKNLASGPEGDRTIIPPFIHTRLRAGLEAGSFPTVFSQTARERYGRETMVWLRRHQFAESVSFQYGHAFVNYWKRFEQTHPEYFAMRPDGKREPFDERHDLVQMCVSNSALHKQIIADWLEQRKNNPSLPWINGAENDKRGEDPSCTCATCKSWDAKGSVRTKENPWLVGSEESKTKEAEAPLSLSDRYARFWLALQEEGRKHDPEATVVGYAYADYTAPPVKTKLNDHIIIWVVPPYQFPLSTKDRSAFQKLWDGWARTGARLVLRPNYFLEGYCMPYIFAKQFGAEFKYAHEHALIGTDFDSLTGMWGVQGPNLYVLGRLHERPDMKVSAVLGEYYAGFGPAAKFIRAYFDYWERITKTRNEAWDKSHDGGWSKMSYAGESIYTPETFKAGRALLADARSAAAGDPEALPRVEFLTKWLKHAELAMDTLAAFRACQREPGDEACKQALAEAQATLDEYRQRLSDETGLVNIPFLNQVEAWSGWRKSPMKPTEPR